MSNSSDHPTSAHHVLSHLSETIRELLVAEIGEPAVEADQRRLELPLIDSDGVLVGVLDPAPHLDALDPRSRALVSTLSEAYDFILRAETERRRAEQTVATLERAAFSDCLTGLPNRRAWERAIEREQARCDRRQRTRVAAVMVDVDGLKRTNDEHGHLAGDLLLRRTADALQRAFRATDVVARIGGDEFGVLAVDYLESDPELLVDRVHGCLSDEGVAASVGVATHGPGRRLADVVDMADAAMYAQKRSRV